MKLLGTVDTSVMLTISKLLFVFISLRVLLPLIRHKATATINCCQIAGEKSKGRRKFPSVHHHSFERVYNPSAGLDILENQEYESAVSENLNDKSAACRNQENRYMRDITDVYFDLFHRHRLHKHDVSKAGCM
jgi:hypothetical protein